MMPHDQRIAVHIDAKQSDRADRFKTELTSRGQTSLVFSRSANTSEKKMGNLMKIFGKWVTGLSGGFVVAAHIVHPEINRRRRKWNFKSQGGS